MAATTPAHAPTRDHDRPAVDEAPPAGRLTRLVLAAAAVSAVSGLLYGYDTGIISGALLQIRRAFHTGKGMEQVIAASILLGAVIGALCCGRLSERHGRHRTLLLISCVFEVGALASALAPSPIALSLARVVLGFAVGGATQTVPMYMAELAPAEHRGRLVLTFQVAIGIGIVVSTIVGASEALSWRVSIGMAAVPATAMLLLMLRLPESPRWLVKRDELDAAREVLDRIRPEGQDVGPELRAIVELEEHESRSPARGWTGLRQSWVRPAIVVGCGLAVFTQLSGIEMIIYYSPTILTDNGFSTSAALLVSVGLGATYLIMMLVGLAIV